MTTDNLDPHGVFVQAATDTDPPIPTYVRLTTARGLREIGDRSPDVAARGFLELLYVDDLGQPQRALTTVDWMSMALGLFSGFEHLRPIADAFESRPFGAERIPVASGTIDTGAALIELISLVVSLRVSRSRPTTVETSAPVMPAAMTKRSRAAKLRWARKAACTARDVCQALAGRRVRHIPGVDAAAARAHLAEQLEAARQAAAIAAERVLAWEGAAV